MNKLSRMSAYLIGNMDYVEDGGVTWREDITPFLQDLGIKVFDPCKKPTTSIYAENEKTRTHLDELKRLEKYEEVSSIMRPIRKIDLRLVDLSHFVIANIDWDARPCGSIEEICWANRLKRPIIIRSKQGKREIPNWLFGLCNQELFFDTWDEIKQYILDVDSGKDTRDFGRWIFFSDF